MCADHGQSVKLVLLGDMYVGKTSLASVFVNEHFREHYTGTVGGHFMAKTLDKPRMTLQIWDTAGMERFRAMLPHYMRGAQCAIFVYDVTNRETFDSMRDYWIQFANSCGTDLVVKVLVSNKSDCLVHAVKPNEGRQLAELYNMLYFETSAKLGMNVDKMFRQAAEETLKKIPTKTQLTQDRILPGQTHHKTSRSCCTSS